MHGFVSSTNIDGVGGFKLPNFVSVNTPMTPRSLSIEEFYFDGWPQKEPVKNGSLTCHLFRHQRGPEIFDIDVLFSDDGDVSGAIRCIVEAENLTKPVEFVIPVSRRFERYNLSTLGSEMIELIE